MKGLQLSPSSGQDEQQSESFRSISYVPGAVLTDLSWGESSYHALDTSLQW